MNCKYNILEIYTFKEGYKGGVSSMVSTYMKYAQYFADNDISLSHLNIQPTIAIGFSKIDNLLYFFTQLRGVARHFKQNEYDLVHIHTSREFLFLKDVFLAKYINKNYNVPIVLTIHVGAISTVFNRIAFLKKYCFKLLNNYISKSIFLSEEMRKDFVQFGLPEEKTSLLYNFFNFEPPLPLPQKQQKGVLSLLFVGSIHREKGILELLYAIRECRDLNIHLNVCGIITDNSIKDEIDTLSKELSDKVSFLGFVSGPDKTNLYSSSDILVLPSYHEGLPLVIMEALGAGLGIVSTKVGAIPEILDEEMCDWVSVASIIDISNAIRNLYSNRDLLVEMKKKNKKQSEEYELNNHLNRLIKLYKECARVI